MDNTVQVVSQILLILVIVAIMTVLLAILWLANLADRRRAAAGLLAARDDGAGAGGPDRPVAAPLDGAGPAPEALGDPVGPWSGEGAGRPEDAAPIPARDLPASSVSTPAPAPAGDPGQGLAIAAYLGLALLYGLLFVAGIAAQLSAGLVGPAAAQPATAGLSPAMQNACGLGLWLPALVGLILILPPVRRKIARLIPIDPRSAVHAVALSYTMMVVINLVISIVTLSSEAQSLANGPSGLFGSTSTLILMTWMQDIYFLVLAAVGVGWLSRRSLAGALRRLGLVVPTWRQVGIAAVLGLAMIPLVLLLTNAAQWLGIPQNADVEKISQALVGPLTQSVFGILTLGLAAALGEEAVFRGALQPRFGLVPTALLFAAMHGQYALSVSTLVVVILGLVLGVVRQRANTSTSMIVHAVYNSSLGLLAFLNIMK